jgi:predicted metalloendopeptidase
VRPDPTFDAAARLTFSLLRARFVDAVERATWIDDGSRRAAVQKLVAVRFQLIDDLERKYPHIELAPGSLRAAVREAAAKAHHELLLEIGRPGTAPVIDPVFDGAVYSSVVNTVWISPELRTPPLVRGGALDPVAFGSLGTVVGHEVAHALSPIGRQYDAAGLRRETWSQQAVAAFDDRVACLQRQLEGASGAWKDRAAFRALNEHVADLGGVTLALAAMEGGRAAVADHPVVRDRRREFFMAYAQKECGLSGNEDMDAAYDREHAPARVRINTVLSNVPEFAETFRCAPGKPMAPQQRCSLW